MIEAYCVKCRTKTEMKNGVEVKMKNGRPAMKGTCAKCKGGLYKILPTAKATWTEAK